MMIRIKKLRRQRLVARTYSSSTDENVNLPPSFHHTLFSSHSLLYCWSEADVCLPQAVSSCSIYVYISLHAFARGCALAIRVAVDVQSECLCQLAAHLEGLLHICICKHISEEMNDRE